MTKKWRFFLIGAFLLNHPLSAQTPFRNLDFEEATFPEPSPDSQYGRFYIADAMPGWRAYIDNIELDLISHNSTFLDSAGITIFDTPGISPSRAYHLVDGKFTVGVFSGHSLFTNKSATNASIAQTGFIPDDTRTMLFKVWHSVSLRHLELQLNGTMIPYHYLFSTSDNIALLAVDVTDYAGQMTELRFVSRSGHSLDSIEFSPLSMDELIAARNTNTISSPIILSFRADGYMSWTNPVNCAIDPVYEIQSSVSPNGPWAYEALITDAHSTFLNAPRLTNAAAGFYRILWVADQPTHLQYDFDAYYNCLTQVGSGSLTLNLSSMPHAGTWSMDGDDYPSCFAHPAGTGSVRIAMTGDELTVWLHSERDYETYLQGRLERKFTDDRCIYFHYTGTIHTIENAITNKVGSFYAPAP